MTKFLNKNLWPKFFTKTFLPIVLKISIIATHITIMQISVRKIQTDQNIRPISNKLKKNSTKFLTKKKSDNIFDQKFCQLNFFTETFLPIVLEIPTIATHITILQNSVRKIKTDQNFRPIYSFFVKLKMPTTLTISTYIKFLYARNDNTYKIGQIFWKKSYQNFCPKNCDQ